MDVLGQFAPELEVYSIDESFLDLGGFRGRDLAAYGRALQRRVRRDTGIPVSVGIAETKTLAKVANHLAKRSIKAGGVLDLTGSPHLERALAMLDVQDVWGIGPRSAAKLRARGVRTALDLRGADDRWIKKQLTVVGLRTVHELRGISCLPLEQVAPARQSVACTRGFGQAVEDLGALREAVAAFVTRSAEKLRRQGSCAQVLTVFVGTNPFHAQEPQYSNAAVLALPVATSSTPELLAHAKGALARLYRPGYRYKRAGVILDELVPAAQVQAGLFEPRNRYRSERLMAAVDELNARWGKDAVRVGTMGPGERAWAQRQERRLPRYTTRWEELVEVGAR